MFVEAVYYWRDEDRKIRKIHVSPEQQQYILKNVKDLNGLMEYLCSTVNPWMDGDPATDILYFDEANLHAGARPMTPEEMEEHQIKGFMEMLKDYNEEELKRRKDYSPVRQEVIACNRLLNPRGVGVVRR